MTFTIETKYGEYKARLCPHNPLQQIEIYITLSGHWKPEWVCVERVQFSIKGEDNDES